MPCAGRMCLPLSPLCLLQCVQFRGSPFSSFYSLINIAPSQPICTPKRKRSVVTPVLPEMVPRPRPPPPFVQQALLCSANVECICNWHGDSIITAAVLCSVIWILRPFVCGGFVSKRCPRFLLLNLPLPLQKLKVSRKQRSHVGRARREMKKHEPKLVENTKTLLALKGLACSSIVTDMLKDLVRATHDCSPFAPASPLPSITSFCTGAQREGGGGAAKCKAQPAVWVWGSQCLFTRAHVRTRILLHRPFRCVADAHSRGHLLVS